MADTCLRGHASDVVVQCVNYWMCGMRLLNMPTSADLRGHATRRGCRKNWLVLVRQSVLAALDQFETRTDELEELLKLAKK